LKWKRWCEYVQRRHYRRCTPATPAKDDSPMFRNSRKLARPVHPSNPPQPTAATGQARRPDRQSLMAGNPCSSTPTTLTSRYNGCRDMRSRTAPERSPVRGAAVRAHSSSTAGCSRKMRGSGGPAHPREEWERRTSPLTPTLLRQRDGGTRPPKNGCPGHSRQEEPASDRRGQGPEGDAFPERPAAQPEQRRADQQ
jgi:hypothetical protein